MAGIAKPDNTNEEMTNYEIISYHSYNHSMYNSRVPHTLFNGNVNAVWPHEGWDFNYPGDNLVIDINERCNLYVYLGEIIQYSKLKIEPATYGEQLSLEPKEGWHLFVKDIQPGRYTFSHDSGYNGTAEWYFEKIKEEPIHIPHDIRLNSNIYKNIFPDAVIDMEYIDYVMENTITSIKDVVQPNHQLELYDVVYLDKNNNYRKAIADNSEKSIVAGIVTKISSNNVFTLMNTGSTDYPEWNYSDTSLMYLSDKYPGKLVHYTDISNAVYIPIAVYTKNSIIINIQKDSNNTFVPYTETEMNFELYTTNELDDIIYEVLHEK